MNMRTYILGAILMIALMALPVIACETPICPPGEVWGQSGQTCYQVPAVYGPCNECPHHHEEVCSDTCDHAYCKNQGQSCSQYDYEHHLNDCKYRRGECLDYDSVKVYDCHSDGYVSCGFEWQHKEKEIINPAHEQCDPIYGCIAVSCPAIPCEEGYSCIESQCMQDVCENTMAFRASVPSGLSTPYDIGPAPATVDFWANDAHAEPLPEGVSYLWDFGDGTTSTDGPSAVYHTYTNPGVYDVTLTVTFPEGCPATVTETKERYILVPEEELHVSNFAPYTEPACQEIIHAQYPMDSIDPSTLPLLNLKNTYISAAFHYASQFDCVDLAYYTRGEPSFSPDCTEVEWWNRVQEEIHIYGGMPVLTALNPAQAICILAVKNSPSETTLPVTITLTDSHGNVGDVLVSSDPVIRQCYQLPEDFSECRVR